MTAATLSRLDWRRLRLAPNEARRGLIAGSAWGLVLAAGFAAMSAWECGGICLPEVALTTAVSVLTGVLAIGPVAAFGARR
jgi:Mg/Co/Ni transporter MgtE